MRVKPKRNKPFVCNQCGEEISTDKNYNKIISISFIDDKKFRYKFCSVQCFDKWNLVNSNLVMTQEPLEEEIKESQEHEDIYNDGEEPTEIIENETKKESLKETKPYVENGIKDYYTKKGNHKMEDPVINYDAIKIATQNNKNNVYFVDQDETGMKTVRYMVKPLLEWLKDKSKTLILSYKGKTSHGDKYYNVSK